MLVVWPPGLCPHSHCSPRNIRTQTKSAHAHRLEPPCPHPPGRSAAPWRWASLAFISLTARESLPEPSLFPPSPSQAPLLEDKTPHLALYILGFAQHPPECGDLAEDA